MTEIHGKGGEPISPRDKELYEQEYIHGTKLFQRALDDYAKSDNPFQKEEFKEVMDKAMNILNETASELKKKSLTAQNEKISQDYEAFKQEPTNQQAREKLNQDLEKAKKSAR